MEDIRLNLTDYKILSVICDLNKNNDYPTPFGIMKILHGVVDNETEKYSEIKAFSSVTTITSKRVSMKALMLYRHRFVDRIYDKVSDALYLRVTPMGMHALEEYFKKHKNGFKKSQLRKEISIAHIE